MQLYGSANSRVPEAPGIGGGSGWKDNCNKRRFESCFPASGFSGPGTALKAVQAGGGLGTGKNLMGACLTWVAKAARKAGYGFYDKAAIKPAGKLLIIRLISTSGEGHRVEKKRV